MSKTLRLDPTQPLESLVRHAIAGNGHLPRRSIDIQIRGQEVVLSGTVPSFYQKQLAQEAVMGVKDVIGVRNELDVIY